MNLQPPVIDVSTLNSETLTKLAEACRSWGIFHITGHGIEQETTAELLDQMHRFFALSKAEKQQVERTATNSWGYYDRELTKNSRDWKEIFDTGPTEQPGPLGGSKPQWPAQLPRFEPCISRYMQQCEQLALTLVNAVGERLNIPVDEIEPFFAQNHSSFLRLNYYPVFSPEKNAANAEDNALGIHPHTDAGALTLLLQDSQPGLQIEHQGKWYTVVPVKGALTVNIGDIFQVLSNDDYRAPLHRVLTNVRKQRYSAAYFFNPSYDFTYAPYSPSPRYSPINWGDFRAARSAGDYSDYGEEIQIEQFRTAP
ncbi:MAG: isopenicillin N synthase family dioxygenase [Pseudomonadales bacterium]